MMNEDGRTDFDLSITIPNTKSRSNMNLITFLLYSS